MEHSVSSGRAWISWLASTALFMLHNYWLISQLSEQYLWIIFMQVYSTAFITWYFSFSTYSQLFDILCLGLNNAILYTLIFTHSWLSMGVSIHPSIAYCLSIKGHRGARAYPSWYWLRSRVHPGEITSPLQVLDNSRNNNKTYLLIKCRIMSEYFIWCSGLLGYRLCIFNMGPMG